MAQARDDRGRSRASPQRAQLASDGRRAMCVVCDGDTSYHVLEHLTVDGYVFWRCDVCGFVTAMSLGSAKGADYSDYGTYLIGDVAKAEFALRRTKRSAQHFIRCVRRTYGPRVEVMDFGAGAGYFVKALRDAGVSAEGVEISERLVDFAAANFGIALNGQVADLRGTFNVVHIDQVLEHIPAHELQALIGEIVGLLRPGGVLWGSTPNIESLNLRLSGRRDPVIAPPEHCSYFSLASLDRLLRSHGLGKHRLFTTGMSSNSFLRPDRFTQSFIERRPSSPASKWLVSYPIRGAFKTAGWALTGTRAGYQLQFRYLKRLHA